MDLQTENQIAAILMKEAAELRLQVEKEGVHLRQPKVRCRPNSRFLTATVLGVKQANRAVEVNEMWRVRQKELELDDRLKGRSRDESRSSRCHSDHNGSQDNRRHRETDSAAALCISRKRGNRDGYSTEDGGLRDEEIDEFLHTRTKRGRGAIGSRMDETGPYLPSFCSDSKGMLLPNPDVRVGEEWENHVLGPGKFPSLKSYNSSEENLDWKNCQKVKKVDSVSSKKQHSKKHKSKEEKPRNKKEKKYEYGHKFSKKKKKKKAIRIDERITL